MEKSISSNAPDKARVGKSTLAFWGGLLIVLVLLTFIWMFLPVKAWIDAFTTWVQQFGLLGALAFSVVYVVAVSLLSPVWFLTVAAGLTYGAWGFPLVVVSATIGAIVAFLVSRFFVRERVRALARSRPTLAAVDNAVKEEGWKVVALLRLSPLVPFNLQNYFFGSTQVGLVPYCMATFFGIMPGTALYIYIGSLGHTAATTSGMEAPQLLILAAGFAATILVIVIVGRKAKAQLRKIGISGGTDPPITPANSKR